MCKNRFGNERLDSWFFSQDIWISRPDDDHNRDATQVTSPGNPLANILFVITPKQQLVVFGDQMINYFPVIDTSAPLNATHADLLVSQCCCEFNMLFEFSPKFLGKMKDMPADSFIVKVSLISNSVQVRNRSRGEVTTSNAGILMSVFTGQLFKADVAEVVDAFLRHCSGAVVCVLHAIIDWKSLCHIAAEQWIIRCRQNQLKCRMEFVRRLCRFGQPPVTSLVLPVKRWGGAVSLLTLARRRTVPRNLDPCTFMKMVIHIFHLRNVRSQPNPGCSETIYPDHEAIISQT
jgi:hypothetical protein